MYIYLSYYIYVSAISFSFLDDIGRGGESANEFLGLFKRLIGDGEWKLYLAVRGVPLRLGQLIQAEIDHLTMLEEATLSSDLSQGFALKALTGEHIDTGRLSVRVT